MLDLDQNCITETRDARGYCWRYKHARDEPAETLRMAIELACKVAFDEAGKSRKTHFVAVQIRPSPSVYTLSRDHPFLSDPELLIMHEMGPAGEYVAHQPPSSH